MYSRAAFNLSLYSSRHFAIAPIHNYFSDSVAQTHILSASEEGDDIFVHARTVSAFFAFPDDTWIKAVW